MKIQESKYYYISQSKEMEDTNSLINKIRESDWVDETTIFVNCAPAYSSQLTQLANHRLSHLNNDQLFEQLVLELPTPVQGQIWNTDVLEYQSFDKYIVQWIGKYADEGQKYLFLSGVADAILAKIANRMKLKMSQEQFRFASLYTYDKGFVPDWSILNTPYEVLFSWENVNNPNWNY